MAAIALPRELLDALFDQVVQHSSELIEDPIPLRKKFDSAIEELLNQLLPSNEPQDAPPNALHGLDNTVLEHLGEEAYKWLMGVLGRVLGDPDTAINIVVNIRLPVGMEVIILETE